MSHVTAAPAKIEYFYAKQVFTVLNLAFFEHYTDDNIYLMYHYHITINFGPLYYAYSRY